MKVTSESECWPTQEEKEREWREREWREARPEGGQTKQKNSFVGQPNGAKQRSGCRMRTWEKRIRSKEWCDRLMCENSSRSDRSNCSKTIECDGWWRVEPDSNRFEQMEIRFFNEMYDWNPIAIRTNERSQSRWCESTRTAKGAGADGCVCGRQKVFESKIDKALSGR